MNNMINVTCPNCGCEIHIEPPAQPEPLKINIEDFNKEDLEQFKKEWRNTPITVLPAQPEHNQNTPTEQTKTNKLGVKSGETYTDTISRQAAIDALNECRERTERSEEFAGLKIAVGVMRALPSAQPEQRWIPVSERLPECEQEVLICTEKKSIGGGAYIDSIITPALYEDGTMIENDSKWRWEDIDYAGWDEEEDCGIIPEGWWENRHFNYDEVYNNIVDRKVVAWMPLPEPYAERRTNEVD